MKRSTSLAAIAIALILSSGCARRNRELPPQPVSEDATSEANDGMGNEGVTGAVLPGSRGDFLQSVPADRVLFDFDSFSLDEGDRRTLDAQASWLARYPNVRVTIEGHADERGTRDYNLALGDRRANAARDYLEGRGVAPSRMQVISWGKERPQVPESNDNAWAQNRRAVTVVPE